MKYSSKWAVALSVTAAAVLVACGGGGGLDVQNTSNVAPPASVTAAVAAGVPVANSPIATLDKKPMVFSTGVAAFGTTAATTVTINALAATPTFAIAVAGTTNTATGEFLLGSCVFKITASNLPAPMTTGRIITVSPCEVKLNTSAVVVNGVAQSVPVTLTFGNNESIFTPVNVSISPTGQLVVAGTSIVFPAVTLVPVTGGG